MKEYKEHSVWWVFNKRIRGYKFHFFHGSYAWELQIGEHVFQWFYRDSICKENYGRAFRHWTDEYGIRKGW